MGFNFPAAPTVGELYPNPEQSGIPQYIWDGSAWQSASGQSSFVERAGDTMLGHLALVENPSAPDAVRKDYVDNAIATNVPPPPDLSGYLPLTGGTMSGGLHFGSVAVTGVDLSRHLDLYGGAYGVSVISGTLNMIAGGAASLQATPGGATVNGEFTVTGSVWANSGQYFFRGNGGLYINHDGTNYNAVGGQWIVHSNLVAYGNITSSADFWTNATVYFRGNGGIYLTHDGTQFSFAGGNINTGNGFYGGYFSSTGDIYAANNITGANQIYSGWGFITNNASGSNPYIASLFGGNPNWGPILGQCLHYPGNWAGFNVDNNGQGTFQLHGGGTCFKSGGAMYWDGYSDERIKRVIDDYKQGLDAVCALSPVRYVYKGNETYAPPSHFRDSLLEKDYPENRAEIEAQPLVAPYANSVNHCVAETVEYVGLVAQQAEVSMPELFTLKKGYIDGVECDDIRSVNYTPLMFAMINAIKELRARVIELETTR